MNVKSKKVQHRQYGVGTVKSQTATMIEVQFNKEYGAKKFIYPSAFELFLELCDTDSKKTMDDELRQIHELIEKERGLKLKEAEQRHFEERRALLDHKRASKKRVCAKPAPKPAKSA